MIIKSQVIAYIYEKVFLRRKKGLFALGK